MDLDTPLNHLPGIGSILSKRLAKLNLFSVEDLLNHYPFRYDDYSRISPIAEIKANETVTIQGDVWSIKNNFTRFGKVITKALLNDGTGLIDLIWFNQSYLTKIILPGQKLWLSGKITRYKNKLSMLAPEWEKVSSSSLHTGKLVAIYPETYGLSSKWLRQRLSQILPEVLAKIDDPLPLPIKGEMMDLRQALNQIHFPNDYSTLRQAQQRLSFDELFFIQLQTQKKKLDWQKKKIISPLKVETSWLEDFLKNLPFNLTKAQKKVLEEIISDLKKDHPMNRLVQGEVGSGKTVVAAAIIYLIFLNKLKAVLMAPTEILAFQHFTTLNRLLSPYGIKLGIYTGSKKSILKSDVIVGTHALLSEKILFDQVGLVVIDEQQRFGVEQRGLLRDKTKSPHFLTMTATPIPRTVALTLYGDLDLSVIDELPPGRKLVKTHFVPSQKRNACYEFIREKLKSGDQAYLITPLIEPSETLFSAKAAKVEYERLKKDVFPDFSLGLLHGRLKSKEKEEVMNNFKQGKINLLVSTSVVEVGVDIPNATIMVIEGAERFGLAQLHQLRGRVGRGSKEAFAFLFTESENSAEIQKVKNLEKIYDGLKLAELDLKIRGSGEIFGTAQSGTWNLKIASLSDLKTIEQARLAAGKILAESLTLDKYPLLQRKLGKGWEKISPD